MRIPFGAIPTLSLARLLSTVLVLWCAIVNAAAAHEVFPSIADMERSDDTLVFTVEGNLESFVAGIDLANVTDTDAAPEAERYDELRALDPQALAAAVEAAWPDIADKIFVTSDGDVLELSLTSVEAGEVGNVELVRASVLTFTAALPEGADTIQFRWDRTLGDVVLRQQGVDAPFTGNLLSGTASEPIPLAGGGQLTPFQAFVSFIPVGVDHIVPLGLDHILFVLGLYFLAQRWGPLLWQVSAFTLAHTITLALAALGYVRISPDIVEPLIAASIVYVAVENVFSSGKLKPWRPLVVFAFGLLHGLGFATVLAEYGLPEANLIPALIGFNVGVELGQLLVILVAFLIVWAAIRNTRQEGEPSKALSALYMLVAVILVPASLIPLDMLLPDMLGDLMPLLVIVALLAGLSSAAVITQGSRNYSKMVALPASVMIGLVGAYWVVERVFL